MKERVLIFDSSSLISIALNGLLPELKKLREVFKGSFIIPFEVREEIIDKPMRVKRFELEALKLKSLLDENILELPSSLEINSEEVSESTKSVLEIANSIFLGKGKDLHIIDSGEAACLALSSILNKKGIENLIVIDERTTRMLVERPENLAKFLRRKLHVRITFNKNNFSFFKNHKIIRSAELMYVAYKKGLVDLKNGMVLDALLYAVKFKGCAISEEEIKEIKKLG